jgi:hypothetical protein
MTHPYFLLSPARHFLWVYLCLLLAPSMARAQAPMWNGAAFGTSTSPGQGSTAYATAIDATGNVFVTGLFNGTVTFGTTTLTELGGGDMFVAKYVPATNTWAWALRAGGTSNDEGRGLAVVGNSVYVLGNFTNSTTNENGVLFPDATNPAGSVVRGATAAAQSDLFLVKYTDNGSSATLAWTQVAGGTTPDYGYGLAASGSNLYVVASIQNDIANTNSVLFGSNGSTPGTLTVRGASPSTTLDLCLAKYVDQGSSASVAWTQVGGGTSQDFASAVAVSGTSVYVTGSLWNNQANAAGVLFGGNGTTNGTTTVRGASLTSSPDQLLAKYIDNGSSATLGWTQVAGGTGFDVAAAVATSGTSVYVSGNVRNNTANANAVLFGGNGTVAGTTTVRGVAAAVSPDWVLTKYTDNGRSATLGWVQLGGGSEQDSSIGLAVSGSNLYVTGQIVNNTANANGVFFGGTSTTTGMVPVVGASSTLSNDVVLTKYTDQGSSATLVWAQVGGGVGSDVGQGVVLSGQQVYVTGYATAPAMFGPTTTGGGAATSNAIIISLTDAALVPLATYSAQVGKPVQVFPNPTQGRVMLTGSAPGAEVEARDVLGRCIGTVTAGSDGTATLVLPTGLYLVRAGTQYVRLVVK